MRIGMKSLTAALAAGVATVTIAVAPVAVADPGPVRPGCGRLWTPRRGRYGGFHGYGRPGGYGWGHYRHWWPWRW